MKIKNKEEQKRGQIDCAHQRMRIIFWALKQMAFAVGII
jgi:hypothetical protein